jgi:DNA-binding response OmpR family regulator
MMSSGHGRCGIDDDNLLSDKMKINLHMLGALMLNEVGEEIHDVDVVIVDKGAPRRQGLELVEQLRSQVASATPLATARYSASTLEREMMVCRLVDQETKLSARNTA